MSETNNNEELTLQNQIGYPDQPRMALSVVQNQKLWQWTNNNDFYKLLPSIYYSFYQNWVREWLYWFDGYVPWVHGSDYGLLSTSIGTTIVNRTTDSVFGGNLMFSNARKPLVVTEMGDKKVGKALDFISNEWSKKVNLKGIFKRAIRDAYAGGFSLLKINKSPTDLWVDELRADRFWVDITAQGEIRKCISILSFYNDMTDRENKKRYALIEERRWECRGVFDEEEMPVIEYKMYDSSVQIQYLSVNKDNCIRWENLPKEVKKAFKSEYAFELNKPQAMNGFDGLGVYLVKGSEDVPQVPQVGLGASLLANITTYLYEYDFYNTAFNTDMYLARGRIMMPKAFEGPDARQQGSQPHGFNEFLYTMYENMSVDGSAKPEAIQFALRSAEWKEARNMLLECIATSIGISVSTLASYLNDGSNRTAREVSAEESATTLFIENARRRFEVPFNRLIADVLRYYGYVDDVEVRWSRAGMTNQTVLVDTLSRAVQSGLISKKKAHHQFNYDDDEEQNEEDYLLVQEDQAQQQNSMFGGFPEGDMN